MISMAPIRRGDVVIVAILGDPGSGTGLRYRSQAMADKLFTVRRTRIRATVGHLANADMARLDVMLAFVLGLAD